MALEGGGKGLAFPLAHTFLHIYCRCIYWVYFSLLSLQNSYSSALISVLSPYPSKTRYKRLL